VSAIRALHALFSERPEQFAAIVGEDVDDAIPLNDAAFGVIESRLGHQHGPYVFYSPMTGDRFKDVKGALAAAVKRAGLGKVTWHMFRHTFASRLTRTGVDIVTVKDLRGHANITTTLRYAHSYDEAKRNAVEGLSTSDKVVTVVPRRAKTANML
jgi:integrase